MKISKFKLKKKYIIAQGQKNNLLKTLIKNN